MPFPSGTSSDDSFTIIPKDSTPPYPIHLYRTVDTNIKENSQSHSDNMHGVWTGE